MHTLAILRQCIGISDPYSSLNEQILISTCSLIFNNANKKNILFLVYPIIVVFFQIWVFRREIPRY